MITLTKISAGMDIN